MALIFGILIMVSVAILGAVGSEEGWLSSQMADWVQGLGTVGAILGTAWIASFPLKAEVRRRQEDRLELLNTISETVEVVLSELEPILLGLEARDRNAVDQAWEQWRVGPPNAMFDTLLAMPTSSWPSPRLYRDVAKLAASVKIVVQSRPGGDMSFGRDQADYDHMIPKALAVRVAAGNYRQTLRK
jgi:hypothetical protein